MAHLLLLKLPSIFADLACGILFCREASKRLSRHHAFFLCAVYLFNPAIVLNSSVWGQVDSLSALLAVILCLSLIRGRLYSGYIAFGLGLLIKPQMLLLGPVLLAGTIDHIWPGHFTDTPHSSSLVRFLRCLFQCLSVAAGGILLCLPFGLVNVVSQLMDTLGSYPYAAVNACNLWGFLGLNWISQDTTFWGISYQSIGIVAIAVTILLTLFISLKNRSSRTKYPFLAAFMVISIFLFSVRMHERYLYPGLVMLLLAYLYKPAPLTYLCYTGFSFFHFLNTAHVLFFYDPAAYDRKSAFILLVSAGMLACGGLLYFVTFRCYSGRQYPAKSPVVVPSRKAIPLKKTDVLCMLAITVIYSCFALYDLGERKAPVTSYDMEQNQSIELDFGSSLPSTLSYYIAPWHDRTFTIEETAQEISFKKVFTWQEVSLTSSTSHIHLTLMDTQASLLELVFQDASGNILIPENAADYPALFDETECFPEAPSFRNGMYFDEIYHGRTAYEFLHGLTSYENTHPPLGKIFIALGVALFGMNPFGWRIIGTLFGIAMVPILYLFARRICGKTIPAALACVLFAFDFMHFTQSRIATIDVYITFFVLLMYFFMYQYTTLSFYDTPLKRTWIPLGASGICMGLGIASKWTGMYAGLGLSLLFFASLYQRYQEYLCAKKDPKGKSCGIPHAHILDCFPKNTKKTILFCLVFFVAVPAVIYLLSYLPFRDYGDRGLISRMLHNQTSMFSYHSQLESTHPYSSVWYEWPLIKRPIWYYSGVITQTPQGGLREGISAFGNPAVWWVGIPAFFSMVWLWIMKKDRTAAFLTVGYLAQYLPWFFVTRSTFIYHYFPSVGFVVLMIMYSLLQWEKRMSKRTFFLTAALYSVAAFGLFLLFYPVLSGQPVEASFVAKYLRWFQSWVLVAK